MILQSLCIFLGTLGSGLLVFAHPTHSSQQFKHLLTFGGSYLFSITLIHLLPELFQEAGHKVPVGNYLLIGFFLQLFLDFFGGCVAHGQSMKTCTAGPLAHHATVSLLLALGLHATLEGVVLTSENLAIWLGLLLHKIPVAFTLGLTLRHRKWKKNTIIATLILFSLATPLGAWSHQILEEHLPCETLLALQALALGSLFHVATIILFEANPNHQFSQTKWIATLLGGILALLLNSGHTCCGH